MSETWCRGCKLLQITGTKLQCWDANTYAFCPFMTHTRYRSPIQQPDLHAGEGFGVSGA